jgi:hypothetical protein
MLPERSFFLWFHRVSLVPLNWTYTYWAPLPSIFSSLTHTMWKIIFFGLFYILLTKYNSLNLVFKHFLSNLSTGQCKIHQNTCYMYTWEVGACIKQQHLQFCLLPKSLPRWKYAVLLTPESNISSQSQKHRQRNIDQAPHTLEQQKRSTWAAKKTRSTDFSFVTYTWKATVRRCKTLKPHGEFDITRCKDILDLEVLHCRINKRSTNDNLRRYGRMHKLHKYWIGTLNLQES